MMKPQPGRHRWPFGAGLDWMRQGLGVLRPHALRLMVLGLALQFIAGLSQASVLAVIFVLMVPVFTAGMLQAMHVSALGRRPGLGVLFAAFGEPALFGRLVLLGLLGLAFLVFAAAIAMSSVVAELDPSLVARLEAGDMAAVEDLDPAVIQRVLLGALAGLVAGACISFFAVPLIWFERESLGRAIGRGLAALARQWRALLVLGGLLGLASMPVGALTAWVMAAELDTGGVAPVLALLLLLLAVFYQLLVFASQYTSFRAVFGLAEPSAGDPPAASGGEDQLVA